MITEKDLCPDLDIAARAAEFGYTTAGLIKAARLALENDAGGTGAEGKEWPVALTLDLAEVFAGLSIEGAERLAKMNSRCQQEDVQ